MEQDHLQLAMIQQYWKKNVQFDQRQIIGELEQLTPINPTQIWIFNTKVVNWIGYVSMNAFNQVHSIQIYVNEKMREPNLQPIVNMLPQFTTII